MHPIVKMTLHAASATILLIACGVFGGRGEWLWSGLCALWAVSNLLRAFLCSVQAASEVSPAELRRAARRGGP